MNSDLEELLRDIEHQPVKPKTPRKPWRSYLPKMTQVIPQEGSSRKYFAGFYGALLGGALTIAAAIEPAIATTPAGKTSETAASAWEAKYHLGVGEKPLGPEWTVSHDEIKRALACDAEKTSALMRNLEPPKSWGEDTLGTELYTALALGGADFRLERVSFFPNDPQAIRYHLSVNGKDAKFTLRDLDKANTQALRSFFEEPSCEIAQKIGIPNNTTQFSAAAFISRYQASPTEMLRLLGNLREGGYTNNGRYAWDDENQMGFDELPGFITAITDGSWGPFQGASSIANAELTSIGLEYLATGERTVVFNLSYADGTRQTRKLMNLKREGFNALVDALLAKPHAVDWIDNYSNLRSENLATELEYRAAMACNPDRMTTMFSSLYSLSSTGDWNATGPLRKEDLDEFTSELADGIMTTYGDEFSFWNHTNNPEIIGVAYYYQDGKSHLAVEMRFLDSTDTFSFDGTIEDNARALMSFLNTPYECR